MNPSTVSAGQLVTLWMQTGKLLGKRFLQSGKQSMNPQQMHALFIISAHDRLTMKELSEHLGITSPSATALVNRLVRMKWVTRITDPSNRRLVRLKIDTAGKAAMDKGMNERSKAMHDVLSLLSPEDRSDFARILSNLHSILREESLKR